MKYTVTVLLKRDGKKVLRFLTQEGYNEEDAIRTVKDCLTTGCVVKSIGKLDVEKLFDS